MNSKLPGVDRLTSQGVAYTVTPADPDPARPWILFVAGVSLSRRCWSDWLPHLASDFNLAALDIPGYGESAISDYDLKRRQVGDWPKYVLDVMDDIGVEKSFMVGEQTGGAAVLFAALNHADRILAGAVISTPFRGAAIGKTISSYIEESHKGGLEAWSDFMLPHLLYPDPGSPIRARIRNEQLKNDLRVILHDGESWSQVDLTADLTSITTPILILAPGSSRVIAREHLFELERRLPNSDLILFGGAGQLLAFTEPQSLSTLTKSFFDRNKL